MSAKTTRVNRLGLSFLYEVLAKQFSPIFNATQELRFMDFGLVVSRRKIPRSTCEQPKGAAITTNLT